jgi:dGTPase
MMRERARYASDPASSLGRQYLEVTGETRGPRTAFQRDRDRIIHAIAFRRLRHKTQVFVAPDGDHFRVRLTHSLEVAQIGRTIARSLGLDEDLTEALCLAHDIGHPPFGHAGEAALETAMAGAGGFDHNGHTLRVLTHIERPYPRWQGLNLSWEVLEGLAKHNGPVMAPGWAMAAVDAAYPLDLQNCPSLEAQVAAIADDIAYDNHDIDDGLRAGLINFESLLSLDWVKAGWARVCARYPDVAPTRLRSELIRQQIGLMVNDVIDETRARIAKSGVKDVRDVRAAGITLCGFSDSLRADEAALKTFMYANLYHHPSQLKAAEVSRRIVAALFDAYQSGQIEMTADWHAALPPDPIERTRHIADFIAGMTDRYAIDRYRQHIGPIDLPEGF